MLDRSTLESLRRRSFDLRMDNLSILAEAGNGHPGGTLSAIDLLQVLFFSEMRHRPAEPFWPERDRLVLSKGHAVPALYTVQAHAGYFPVEKLWSLRKLGSPLQGHPVNFMQPGIEVSSGSLGQGLSVGIGMALASRADDAPGGRGKYRVYVLLGDGECQEGQVWEAAMAAPKFGLDNLCAIVDYNKAQIDGHTNEVMDLEPLADKWRAFRWNVLTIDGHDFAQITDALQKARATTGRPTVIIANTVKGKGVSFMEDNVAWHGVAPTKEQLEKALVELRAAKAAFEAELAKEVA